jgi:hypothetical protein
MNIRWEQMLPISTVRQPAWTAQVIEESIQVSNISFSVEFCAAAWGICPLEAFPFLGQSAPSFLQQQ